MKRNLASLCAAMAAATIPATADQYALLVAIDDYSNVEGASNLPGCSTDLNGVKQMLTGQLGFPAANVKALVDGQATKANVLRELQALVEKARPDDAIVFYYSGHGGQVPDLNDDDEVSDNLDEALITSDFDFHDQETWLLDDHLRASLSQLKTKRALVLVDACHSGTGTRSNVINKRAEFGFSTMLGRGRRDKGEIETDKNAPDSHVLISGCAANEVSALGVYDGVQRSLFTTALLNVMPRTLSSPLAEVKAALHAEMARLAPAVAREQNPQLETTLTFSLSTLLGAGGGGAALAAPNNEPVIQQPSDGLPSAFPVSVAADKRSYDEGDAMVASVLSERPGYLRLYYVDKTGDATLIFPNHHQRDNRIQGGQRVEVGGSQSKFAFRMKAPGGTEMLLAAVSEEQFTDHAALNFSENEPVKAMGKVSSIRGMVDNGTKQIAVEGRPGAQARPAQIGRASSFYEIREARKSAEQIVKQIQVEGRADFDEGTLPFKFDSTELAGEAAQRQLVQIARALQSPQLANARFVIEGHTCDTGKDDYNLDLSKRRAAAIESLLARAGIPGGRFQIVGKGETSPLVANSSEGNRAKNRRVELKLDK